MLPTTYSKSRGSKIKVIATPRLPRKHALRIRKEIIAFAVVFTSLSLFLRHLHKGRALHVTTRQQITPRNTIDDITDIPRNLYYLRKENVMYCYIPKNACSRVKPIVRKREGFANWDDPKFIHGRKNGLQRLLWLDRKDAFSRLNDTSTFRFVVVRDPFSRLVSAYQNKIATPWPDQREDFWNIHLRMECPSIIDSRRIPAEGPLLSLLDFLKCLNADDALQPSNEHWRPQSELCGLDFIKYNKYIFLESLQTGLQELMHDLKWNENTDHFQIQRKPVYERDLASYFDDESIKLALQYYRQDFELLGYPVVPTGKIGFFSVFNGTNFQPGFVPPVDYQPPVENSS